MGQTDAFFGDNFTYRAIATNDRASTNKGIIEYYNQRGAAEKIFEEMNNDFGWKNLPFYFLQVNTVYMILTIMCRNFHLILLEKKDTNPIERLFLLDQSHDKTRNTMSKRYGGRDFKIQIGIYQSNSCILKGVLEVKGCGKAPIGQYLKEDYAENVLEDHLGQVCPGRTKESFILMNGTDISKKYAKYMEGLEFVRNGDIGTRGLGYNVLNINAINTYKEIILFYSKA